MYSMHELLSGVMLVVQASYSTVEEIILGRPGNNHGPCSVNLGSESGKEFVLRLR